MSLVKAVMEYSKNKGKSVAEFERIAGVPKGTIYNISSGRSRHPRTDTMGKIAAAIEKINQDEQRLQSNQLSHKHENELSSYYIKKYFPDVSPTNTPDSQSTWNVALYLDATKCIIDEMKVTLPKHKALEIIDEVYNYSFKNGCEKADRNFARWILEK